MKRFFKKLFKRGDFMTRADKAYYGHKFKTMFWSVFSMIIISWVGTNLVLCALATNVSSNWDIIYEAEQPTILPIGEEVNAAIKGSDSFSSHNSTVESVTFDRYSAGGKYMVDDVDVVATCNTSSTKVALNDDVTLYRMNENKNVYILSNKKIQANPDSSYMFYCFEVCTTYTFKNFDTSLVNNMKKMFAGDADELPRQETLQISNSGAYISSNKQVHGYAVPVPGKPTCFPHISKLDLSSWDTSNVTNMFCMFLNCIYLSDLNTQGWDTSKVTNMSYMFDTAYSATYRETLDLSSFNTSSVQSYTEMLRTDGLKTIYISDRWNLPSSVIPSGCSVEQKEYTGKGA